MFKINWGFHQNNFHEYPMHYQQETLLIIILLVLCCCPMIKRTVFYSDWQQGMKKRAAKDLGGFGTTNIKTRLTFEEANVLLMNCNEIVHYQFLKLNYQCQSCTPNNWLVFRV